MKNKQNGVIVDYRASEEIIKNLEKLDLKIILSTVNKAVSPSLCAHPDMQICKCSENTFVCSPDCYDHYKKVLSEFNVNLIQGGTFLNCNYPQDIAYNVAWIGDSAVHNISYTDQKILDFFKTNNISVINVSQGYSKCNICVVSNNAVITSDRGVYNVLKRNQVDVLLIGENGIDIFGWDRGFIGGASGKIGDNLLVFCGDFSMHEDCERIKTFCSKYNVECVSLSNERLMDFGSVIYIKNHFV